MNTEKAKKALAAVLMFHGGGPWDNAKRLEWLNLSVEILGDKTGAYTAEATTRNLCILVREALESSTLSNEGRHALVTIRKNYRDTPMECLLSLKRQLETAIAIVETGELINDPAATAEPFRFRIGDFGIYDFTGHQRIRG